MILQVFMVALDHKGKDWNCSMSFGRPVVQRIGCNRRPQKHGKLQLLLGLPSLTAAYCARSPLELSMAVSSILGMRSLTDVSDTPSSESSPLSAWLLVVPCWGHIKNDHF